VIIVKNSNNYCSAFLSNYLNTEKGQKSILIDAMGGAQGVFNTTIAKALLIPVPDIEERLRISEILSKLELAIETVKQKLHQTQLLKKALMQDLLTGKVRVKVT
jgi:type I restriction enzyme S subunit